MDKTGDDRENRFLELLAGPTYPVDEMLSLMDGVPEAKASEWTVLLLTALQEAGDFMGAWRVVSARKDGLEQKLQPIAVRNILRSSTKDRMTIAFIDTVFPTNESGHALLPLKESLARLERLLLFPVGAMVLHQAWGVGEVKRLDAFYRRMTVDFYGRRGHQLSFQAACETLVPPPEGHILVTQKADPARIAKMLAETPGEFAKEMLKSFGDMPVSRLEELCSQFGFVKKENFKAFWSKARTELRKDKLVEIPTSHKEPMHLKSKVEDYGEGWLTAFSHQTDPKSILSSVKELEIADRIKGMDDATREKLSERLEFALKASRGVDDALYARIAFAVKDIGLAKPALDKPRAYLWEMGRYLEAARTMPARNLASLVKFLTADDESGERKRELFARLPEMCFPLLGETLEAYKSDGECEEAVAALLKQPHAPATVITYILGRYDDFSDWKKLPPLVVILTHAIALGEGKQGGETLKMQNTIRRLFADEKWLDTTLKKLSPADRALFFERFQASIAWDPSTHHLIVVRMTRLAPELASRLVKSSDNKKAEVVRITSMRSYAERKAAYLNLINVEIPKNAHDIDVARSYGDLRENFEYQSAKDEQRALLQKQSVMQAELDSVKYTDFAGADVSSVNPGTMVDIVSEGGEERTYTILGEWDNDLEKGILSCKTKLAGNMIGLKPGETFDLPGADGSVSKATVKGIRPLDDEMKEWIKVPAGLSL